MGKAALYLLGGGAVMAAVLIPVFVATRNASGGPPPTVYTVNQTTDGGDWNIGDDFCDTSLIPIGSQCTLRAAIQEANFNPDVNTINFNIGGGGSHIISLSSLPGITEAVTIDGFSQPGSLPNSNPLGQANNATYGIIIDGDGAGTGFLITTGGGTTIRGLVVSSFVGSGILISGGGVDGGNSIIGNVIGMRNTGLFDLGNGLSGVTIISSPNNAIGTSDPADMNLINANNAHGVQITGDSSANNVIQGNYIGVSGAGTADLGNEQDGVHIEDAPGTIIGGDEVGQGNVISGNDRAGVRAQRVDGTTLMGNRIGTDAAGTADLGNADNGVSIFQGSSQSLVGGPGDGGRNLVSGNGVVGLYLADSFQETVQNNYIGTDVTGNAAIPNSQTGLVLVRVGQAMVGGTEAAERNVISGNAGPGLAITETDGATIHGNYIGLGVDGVTDVGNGLAGVLLTVGSDSSTIGGATAGARNVVSGNGLDGILIDDAASSLNTIAGNYIGTNAAGMAGVPNDLHGVRVFGHDNTIGGEQPGAGNVISGNANFGVGITGTGTGNDIIGNIVGLGADGSTAVPNKEGIRVSGKNNVVGGDVPGAGNVVSRNDYGIVIHGVSADFNSVLGNLVGTDATGTQQRRNSVVGMSVNGGNNNTFGSDTSDGANLVAFNGAGIWVFAGVGNSILVNSIHSNFSPSSGVGIDLQPPFGPDTNDDADGDTGGNNGQNYPELSSALSDGTIQGSLNSTPGRAFTIRFFANGFCDSSGYGEGEFYLGSAQVNTNGSGDAQISADVDSPPPGMPAITATATDETTGDTSEFSACITAAGVATPTATPTPSPSGTPTSTPTVTPTATPTATPIPTPTGTPDGLIQGDVDCNSVVDSVDALKILRYVANLSVSQEDRCPDIGSDVASLFGDVDCSVGVDSVDALKVLRSVALLSVAQPEQCVDIGDPL